MVELLRDLTRSTVRSRQSSRSFALRPVGRVNGAHGTPAYRSQSLTAAARRRRPAAAGRLTDMGIDVAVYGMLRRG